ncbi:MAG: UDP-glucose/GDP-mannose dehydrogenase family protein [Nocardioides sp.]
MRTTTIGCGYLGSTHSACMAELGYDVLGLEVDPAKLELLRKGIAPVYEPGLSEMLARHVESGRLRFTDSYEEAAAFGEIHFLCLGTPQSRDGLGADTSQVEYAVEHLAPHLTGSPILVGKSTVPVGTAQRMAAVLDALVPEGVDADLAWNPEFLREAHAVDDTLRPDRVVFGVRSETTEKRLREFFAPVIDGGMPVVVTDYPTAELVKVTANSFLATKISFINAVAEVCEAAGADVVALSEAIGYDDRIGRKMLGSGVGFGGGCLPKDLRAFQHRSGELGVEDLMTLLGHVDAINQHQRDRAVQIATTMVDGRLDQARIAVWGAAFKPGTDDVRDSPALQIAGQLHLRGAQVTIHDPKAGDTARLEFPTMRYADNPVEACRDADLVMHMTEWPEFREVDIEAVSAIVASKQLLDGRNILDLAAWREAGWTARGLGRH